MKDIIAKEFSGKNIVITGAAGFVGANLVKKLLQEDAKVHILIKKSSHLWRITPDLPQVSLHYTDLKDIDKLRDILTAIKPDFIFHLAAHGAYPEQIDVPEMIAVNITGTFNLLEASRDIPYQLFIYTGSSSEYGLKSSGMKETDRLNPVSFYGVTKASATQLCTMFATRFQKPVITFRLFSVYGPYEEPTRLIPTLGEAVLHQKPIYLTAGKIRRDFIFIDDVVEAYLTACTSLPLPFGAIFNIGTGHEYTNDEVVDALFSVTGQKTRVEKGRYQKRQWDTSHWRANVEFTKHVLGWRAHTTLPDGLLQFYTWYKNNHSIYGSK